MAVFAILSGVSAGLIAVVWALLMQKGVVVALMIYPAAGLVGFATALCLGLAARRTTQDAVAQRIPAERKAFGHQS